MHLIRRIILIASALCAVYSHAQTGAVTKSTASATLNDLAADLNVNTGRVVDVKGGTFRRTGTGVVTLSATLQALSVTNGANLDALAAVASNGALFRTAAGTYAARSITGTTGQVGVEYGDGVTGNPRIYLPTTITQATTFSEGLRVTGTITPDGGAAYFYNQPGVGPTIAGNAIDFRTNGNSGAARITATGNLLIGTTTDSGRRLSVYGAGEFKDASGIALTAWSEFSAGRAGIGTNNNYPLAIATNGVARLNIAASGEVTFYSTSPSTSYSTGSITTAGGIGASGAIYTNSLVNSRAFVVNGNESTSTTSGAGIFGTASGHSSGFGALLISSRNDASKPIIFLTHNGSAQGERMRIEGSGAVTIGAPTMPAFGTAPSLAAARASSASDFWYSGNSSNGAAISFYSDGGSYRSVSLRGYTTTTGTTLLSADTTQVAVPQTTASTSTTTGALTVGGGIGVGGEAFIGGTVTLPTGGKGLRIYDATASYSAILYGSADRTFTFLGSSTSGDYTTTYANAGSGKHGVSMSGNLSVTGFSALGNTPNASAAATVGSNAMAFTGADQYTLLTGSVFTAAATNTGTNYHAKVAIANGTQTLSNGYGLRVETPLLLGTTNAITTNTGVRIENQGAARVTNAYGIDIAAQSGASTKNVGLRNGGSTELNGTVRIGSNGTAADLVASVTATLDFGSISAGATAELTITVTGASSGDSVALGAPTAIEAGLMAFGYVSAANTVTVRLHNTTGSPIDPASASYRATVMSF